MRKHLTPEADDWWGSVAMATGTTHAAAPFAHASVRVNTERRSFLHVSTSKSEEEEEEAADTRDTVSCLSVEPQTET